MPADVNRTIRIAEKLLAHNKRHEAGAMLVKLIKRFPNNEIAWYLLSFTQDDIEKRIFALNRAIEMNPENQKTRAELTSLLTSQEKAQTEMSIQLPPSEKIMPFSIDTLSMFRESSQELDRFSFTTRLRIRASLAFARFKMGWAVFSQDRLAMLGIGLIMVFGLMAIAHPILMKTIWERKLFDPYTGFDTSLIPIRRPRTVSICWVPMP